MTIQGVTIGDKFIPAQYRQAKTVCTVIDFLETKSLVIGDYHKYECMYECEILGQKYKNIVPFATVIRNKITNQ